MAINLDNLFNKPKSKGINIDKFFPQAVDKPVEKAVSRRVTPSQVAESIGTKQPINAPRIIPQAPSPQQQAQIDTRAITKRTIPQAPPQKKFGIFGDELSEQDKINIRTRGQFPDIFIDKDTIGPKQVREAIKTTPAIGEFQKKELEDLSRGTKTQKFLSGLQEDILPLRESQQALLERETGLKADIEPSAFRTAGQTTGKVTQFLAAHAALGPLVGAKLAVKGIQLAKGGKIAQATSKVLGSKLGAEIVKDFIISSPINANINDRKARELGLEGADYALFMGKNMLIDTAIDVGANVLLSKVVKALKNSRAGKKEIQEVVEMITENTDIPKSQIDEAFKNIDIDTTGALDEGITRQIRGQQAPTLGQTGRLAEEAATRTQTIDEILTGQKARTGVVGKQTPITPELPKSTLGKIGKQTSKVEIPQEVAVSGVKAPELSGISKVDGVAAVAPKTPVVGESVASFTETAKKSDVTGTELRQLLEENKQILGTTTNEAREKLAREIVDSNPEGALALLKEGEQFTSSTDSFIGEILAERLQDAGRFDDALEVIETMSKKFREAGQQVQAASIWSKTTPQGMVKWGQKTLDKAGIKMTPAQAKQIDESMRIVKTLDDDAIRQRLVNSVDGKFWKKIFSSSVEKETRERLINLNVARVMTDITDQIPKTLGQKISSFQAISHLLNAKTMLRNIFGNTTFGLIETINKLPASGFDKIIAKRTGKKTVSAGAGIPKSMVPFKEGFTRGKRSIQEILLDTNVLDQGKYDLFKGRTFKAPVLSGAEKGMSIGLKTPDEFAKGTTKTLSIIDQMRLRLGKSVDDMELDELMEKVTKEELEIAEQESKYSTFQDNSLPAQLFRNMKETLNVVGVGRKIKGKSREFGLGDLIIKYTTVPGNLISRGIEYSPLGYLKALHNMGLATGKFNQRAAAQSFGRATTGLGLISMGTWLANKGLIVSDDKTTSLDARALDRSEGLGNYKINLTAVGRLIDGGNPEKQDGDILSSYNWNEPVGTALAIGATYNNNLEKGEADFSNIVSKSMEEMLDLPTLYFFQQLMYEGMDDSENKTLRLMSLPITSNVSGFVPGPIRQAAQLVDPTIRDTRGETPIETAKLKIKSSIPGLSKQLEPRISPLGKEIKRDVSPLKTFVSPGIITKFKPSEITPKLKVIAEITGETTHFPSRKAPNKVTINKVKLELTPKEKTEYQKTSGTLASERMGRLLKKVDTNKLSAVQAKNLAKQLKKIKDKSRSQAKRELIQKRGN